MLTSQTKILQLEVLQYWADLNHLNLTRLLEKRIIIGLGIKQYEYTSGTVVLSARYRAGILDRLERI